MPDYGDAAVVADGARPLSEARAQRGTISWPKDKTDRYLKKSRCVSSDAQRERGAIQLKRIYCHSKGPNDWKALLAEPEKQGRRLFRNDASIMLGGG
jgi:hypothetical protein